MLQIGDHILRTPGPDKMLSFKYPKNYSGPEKAELFCVAPEYRIWKVTWK